MTTKICMLVTAHSFLDARIFKKEAKSLLKKGYDVTMIVPRIKGNLFDVDGKILQIPSKAFIHEGVKIITYDAFDYHNQLKDMLVNIDSGNHQGFSDPLTQLGVQVEADIYHAHEPFSFYSGIGIKRGLQAKKGKNVKLIYDSHEIDPDPYHPVQTANEKIKRYILKKMLKEVDYVIVVSDSMKSWYLSFEPSLPVEVIYNSPPLAANYTPKTFENDRFVIVHEGAITSVKGNFVKLTKILEICNENTNNFQFKIIGGIHGTKHNLTIPPHLKDKIQITGWIDYYSIPDAMKDASLGWIDFGQLNYSLNRQYALPNKFFSYLNNGVPVIVNKCPEMAKYIKKHQCGIVIDKENATANDYAQAIRSLYNKKDQLRKMSINARKSMVLNCWEKMEVRLFKLYSTVTN